MSETTLFDLDRKPVSLELSWYELLGKGSAAIPEAERRQRWEQWLSLAPEEGREYWTDTEGCEGCVHLDGSWCNLQGLPATVNPYLTMKHGGGVGMACMGMGWADSAGRVQDGFGNAVDARLLA